MGCTSPHLMDYIDHVDRTWFANEDARDNLSLLRLLFEALSVYWSLCWAFSFSNELIQFILVDMLTSLQRRVIHCRSMSFVLTDLLT